MDTPTWLDAFEPDELFALAQLDLEKGQTSEALWKLKRLTQGAEVPTGAYSVCGQVYVQLGLWDRAQRMFQKHLSLYPESVGEMFQLGLAHRNAGRTAEAVGIWDELLQKSPAYPPALFYRALMRVGQGQLAAAKSDLDILVKYAPVEDPFFKQAKELAQNLDFQIRSAEAVVAKEAAVEKSAAVSGGLGSTKPPAVLSARARSAYRTESLE